MLLILRRSLVTSVSLAVMSLVGFSGGACSSSSSSPVVPVSASIGAKGGTVTTSDGASVVIPAGALSTTITVGIAQTSAPMALPSGFTAASAPYEFTPEGQTFAEAITITIPTSTSTGIELFTAESGGAWTQVAGAVAGQGSIAGKTTHFSGYQAGAPGSSSGGSGGGPGLCVLQSSPTGVCNQSSLACPQPLLPGGVAGSCPAAGLLGCCVEATESTCYYTASSESVGTAYCSGLGGTWQSTLP